MGGHKASTTISTYDSGHDLHFLESNYLKTFRPLRGQRESIAFFGSGIDYYAFFEQLNSKKSCISYIRTFTYRERDKCLKEKIFHNKNILAYHKNNIA